MKKALSKIKLTLDSFEMIKLIGTYEGGAKKGENIGANGAIYEVRLPSHDESIIHNHRLVLKVWHF